MRATLITQEMTIRCRRSSYLEAGSAGTPKAITLSLEANKTTADLVVSLDIIYHLVEDAINDVYMSQLILPPEIYLHHR